MTAAGFLDWRGHRVGPPLPCRICANPAMCRDHLGRPCHKTCAEQAPAAATADPVALVVDLDAYRTTRTTTRRRTA
ncbi:hypothetical protein [Actinoplanes sp. NPDC049599]|uniref:hypothetical protein n=1 Tax=Actinoplanes sp. NPDC049599 TaxID=3363903 RepID=UPI0037BC860A